MSVEPLVSVIITTYNQAPYIEKAILGVISQKTKYPFEIIIHDDASTDGTSDIVRLYQEKYPELVFATIQTENLYSRNIPKIPFTFGRARGKYVLSCEGDDCWTDENKVELQVSYLESHPECSMVCHAYKVLNCCSGEEHVIRCLPEDGFVQLSDLIHNRTDNLPQTATFAYRLKDRLDMPQFYRCIPMVGDYPLRLYLATLGTIYYIDREMSLYRLGTSGSFTERYRLFEPKQKAQIENGYIAFLTEYLNVVPAEYRKEVEEELDKHEYLKSIFSEDFKNARKNRAFKQRSRKERVLIHIGCCSKRLYRILSRIVARKQRKERKH